jgi:FMN phosphatase YigB (HAD superfamily)
MYFLPKNIEEPPRFIIYDNDQVVSPYWIGYADKFYEAAAMAAQKLSPRAARESLSDLAKRAYDCFFAYGNVTKVFFDDFDIDEGDLYIAYHQIRMRGDIPRDFPKYGKVDTCHRSELLRLKQSGVRLFVLTHGATEYAEQKLRLKGLSGIFEDVVGLNSYDNFHPSVDKKTEKFWRWALERFSIFPQDYSHTIFIDDSKKNLEIPYRWGIKTTWMKVSVDNTVPMLITEKDRKLPHGVTTDVVAFSRYFANRCVVK